MKRNKKILLKDVIAELEKLAPPTLQESYDNSGLLVGEKGKEVTGALICLDCTEQVLREARRRKCNLVIAHHPVIFSGLKQLTGADHVQRTIISAVKNEIAIYAIHTNLDNVIHGVNNKLCEKLGITNTSILNPSKEQLSKMVTFCPGSHSGKVKDALFRAGAGGIGNYDECSFTSEGTGTFRGNDRSDPFTGKKNERHHEPEERIEVIFERWKGGEVLAALIQSHPYEEVAYDIYRLENRHGQTGSGMIGELERPVTWQFFFKRIKNALGAKMIRHTDPVKEKVSRIAVCGGSGSFLLDDAVRAGADVFVTSDFKYHQFFDADGNIMVADVGHFESEQFTGELLLSFLREKFPKFALHLTQTVTNPVNYF